MIQTSSLHEIFHPRSVAVIGASQDERKWGYVIAKRLIDGGYPGEIYLINPKARDILGRKSFQSITDVPGPVDTVIIGVSSKYVLTSVKECADKRVKGIVIVTSGFGEIGSTGKLLGEKSETARKGGIGLLAPNCLESVVLIKDESNPKLKESGRASIALLSKRYLEQFFLRLLGKRNGFQLFC